MAFAIFEYELECKLWCNKLGERKLVESPKTPLKCLGGLGRGWDHRQSLWLDLALVFGAQILVDKLALGDQTCKRHVAIMCHVSHCFMPLCFFFNISLQPSNNYFPPLLGCKASHIPSLLLLVIFFIKHTIILIACKNHHYKHLPSLFRLTVIL